MDLLRTGPWDAAARLWASLDKPWEEAFCQAWEALRSGNIAVGACASTPDGQIVHSARNRIYDGKAPPGEIFGSALAHAETNVLARLPFGRPRDLVLTTTLQPCLQCAADLVHELEDRGEVKRLAAMDVNEALGYLWPQLQELTKVMPAP